MSVFSYVGAMGLQLLLPLCVGGIFYRKENTKWESLFESFLLGQLFIWTVFQIVSVPMILFQRMFSELTLVFSALVMILGVCGILRYSKCGVLHKGFLRGEKKVAAKDSYSWLWILFWVIFAMQLVLSVFMTYQDGDDAFYVAISSSAAQGGAMYRNLPYTGVTSALNARYGLAPFPLWTAYISRLSGVKAVTVAHILQPLVYMPMTMGVFALIGSRLLGERKRFLPLYMVFSELLVLFGDYSIMSPENFLVARSRQGKAMLATVILPMLIFLLLRLLQDETMHTDRNADEKVGKMKSWLWAGIFFTVMSSCLCSTMGGLVCGLMLSVVGICSLIAYRRVGLFIGMVMVCIPTLVFAFLYLILG